MLAHIKKIQKIDRHKLPHAEKQALIQIAILISENNLTPDNQTIGENIGENADYAKNLLSRLKSKGYIKLIGRGKKRRIEIIWAKIFGNSQLPNYAVGNSQLPNQPLKPPTPINIYEDRVNRASPDFFEIEKQHDKLPDAMELIPDNLKGKVPKKAINWWLYENYQGLDYLRYLGRISTANNIKNPIKYYMAGIWNYYRDYLTSEEFQAAEVRGAILDAGFKLEAN